MLYAPRVICSTRRDTPRPCRDSKLNALRMRRSRVPWRTGVCSVTVLLSNFYMKLRLLLSTVNRRRLSAAPVESAASRPFGRVSCWLGLPLHRRIRFQCSNPGLLALVSCVRARANASGWVRSAKWVRDVCTLPNEPGGAVPPAPSRFPRVRRESCRALPNRPTPARGCAARLHQACPDLSPGLIRSLDVMTVVFARAKTVSPRAAPAPSHSPAGVQAPVRSSEWPRPCRSPTRTTHPG